MSENNGRPPKAKVMGKKLIYVLLPSAPRGRWAHTYVYLRTDKVICRCRSQIVSRLKNDLSILYFAEKMNMELFCAKKVQRGEDSEP